MELSIDTSTRYAATALSRQGAAISALSWRSERNHSVELVPAIRRLMEHSAVEMSGLQAIFVAVGPGGFSALRVGISTAKGLALALKKPLVSVVTLDIEAEPYLGLGAPVCALIEAGSHRFYAGRYPAVRGELRAEYQVATFDEIVSNSATATLFCGEGVAALSKGLGNSPGTGVLLANTSPPTRTGAVLASLGYRRWQAGLVDDPATLQPMYLRNAQVDEASRRLLQA